MAEASTIGGAFSSYTGDPNLGGGSLGAFQLDTRYLYDFARYAMLYNREEQARKQREAEKAAEELGKIADYDLTTSIQKDAKHLQQRYDRLISYVKQNPGALQFKNRDQWIEYQRMKNELANDIRGAKTRNVMNIAREREIGDQKDEDIKAFMRSNLDKEIADTDIRTPIKVSQEYDLTIPKFEENKGQSILVNRRLPNEIFQDDYEIFDAAEADRTGAAMALDVAFDTGTTTGNLKDKIFKKNIYTSMRDRLNEAIKSAELEVTEQDPAKKQEQIKAKLASTGILKNMVNIFEDYNRYVGDVQKRFQNQELSGNGVNPDSYNPINWADGVSDVELAKAVQYLNWKGDKKETKIIQTNEAIEKARLAAEWARIGVAEAQLNKSSTEDLISATAVIREAADVLNSGQPFDIKEGGKTRRISRITDPNLLKEFGTIDKDNNVTNVPDDVYYDKPNNKLKLVYYMRDDEGKIITTKKEGGTAVDRQVDLVATQWLGQIAKRKNPNKDIGGVNALIETFFNTKGVDRKLENLSLIYGTNLQGTTGKSSTQSSSTTTPGAATGKKRVYKGLDANGDPIFVEE